MRTFRALWALLALSVIIGASMLSCTPQDANEAMINAAIQAEGGDAKVNLEGETMTITSDEGTVVFNASGGAVPADFPSDVPLPGGYKLIGTMSSDEGHVLSFEYGKKAPDLQAEFKNGLKGQGWKLEAEMTVEDGGSLQFSKDDRNAFIMISWDGSISNVSLTVAKD